MEVNKDHLHSENLRRRRQEIDLTLRHLENERRQVEANTEWANRAAYQSRVRLLDRLTRWYRDEINHLEAAIGQARKAGSARCAACHEAIDPTRLATSPDTELCADCEAARKRTK
ncbi:MAG TPA: TraR/DksA C4-type zinc finger protein [Candidatus Limnocylindria bacterium]|nr:TraR/DksA C4-type zinc finger protein [Candidatus Limnocylindria bacterium]